MTPITDQDIQALETLLANMKAEAKEAHSKDNLTTFRIYQRIVKMVSPEVQKANARKEREDQARMNKDGLALKAKLTPDAERVNDPT